MVKSKGTTTNRKRQRCTNGKENCDLIPLSSSIANNNDTNDIGACEDNDEIDSKIVEAIIESTNNEDESDAKEGTKRRKKNSRKHDLSVHPQEQICKRKNTSSISKEEPILCESLRRIDPILQFLTRATGKSHVPLKIIHSTLSKLLQSANMDELLHHIVELSEIHHVLQLTGVHDIDSLEWDTSDTASLGYPPPPSSIMDAPNLTSVSVNGTLHGSTKMAAKRRLAALKRSLQNKSSSNTPNNTIIHKEMEEPSTTIDNNSQQAKRKDWSTLPLRSNDQQHDDDDDGEEEPIQQNDEMEARSALRQMFHFEEKTTSKDNINTTNDTTPQYRDRISITTVLPKQASYAGSHPARTPCYPNLQSSQTMYKSIPSAILDAFNLERSEIDHDNATNITTPSLENTTSLRRKLYSHQAVAILSAMNERHTLVCTGTGSGKSLCFLLPVLTAACCSHDDTSILLFPTKALAQDQMTKLKALILRLNPSDLRNHIRPGIIDGDTPHVERSRVAKECNIVMTNPDTLHASILPNWKTGYKSLLGRIKYVVIDEAHMYEGVFGAHVAMVLSRFMRLAAVCSHKLNSTIRTPIYLACSATMAHPEHHFRLLCPIPTNANVTIVTSEEDGSPRAAKHFFVWNPPIMDINGMNAGRVTLPIRRNESPCKENDHSQKTNSLPPKKHEYVNPEEYEKAQLVNDELLQAQKISLRGVQLYRRHPADETALLLARAVTQNVRCIAFCKTRCLVEWVYERAVAALKSCPSTEHLVQKIDTYRGGYTMKVRRSIESRLFHNDLIAVIGTNALELGVDVGGIDLTLHCGYPTSYASLLQQAGRAGRGAARLHVPSVAIMVCFNSPAEQQIWKRPKTLLGRCKTGLVSMPINVALVQGHLLCAGEEYPLTGADPISKLFATEEENDSHRDILSDCDYFGSDQIYRESMDGLLATGMVKERLIPVAGKREKLLVHKTHPFISKPWNRVNLRSIEPINYSIVDLSHPSQGGRMDSIHSEDAVLDNIPYSRIFYHAFPGAVITHRGRRYKVQSMTSPPVLSPLVTCGPNGGTFAAYAKPTSARYTTRPLSTMKITVVKQIDRIDELGRQLPGMENNDSAFTTTTTAMAGVTFGDEECLQGTLAGNGVLTVCRTVHGYKKLSPITRAEISRTEFSLPSMEFETFGFWLDTEASVLREVVKDYNEGVHALSHAILAVAPLFVPCCASDLNCDHSVYDCTRIVIFDMRAGGSGNSAQLFRHLFLPDGLLETAIDLMETCAECNSCSNFDGGCPSCLHFGQCLKFNLDLSRTAAIHIGKRLLKRIQCTDLYRKNVATLEMSSSSSSSPNTAIDSPKRINRKIVAPSSSSLPSPPSASVKNSDAKRRRALRNAKEVAPTKERNVVMGRALWPVNPDGGLRPPRQVEVD